MLFSPHLVLPPIIRGEALRSYTDRVQLLSAGKSRSPRSRNFLSRLSTPDWCLPAGLEEFVSNNEALFIRSTPRTWVNEHTHAPYFQSTLSASKGEELVRRLLMPTPGPRRPLLPVALSEWFCKQPILCPVCEEESLSLHGFSHVQRHWLLPFLSRCHVHGTPLFEFPKWTPLGCGDGLRLPIKAGRHDAGVLLSEVSLSLLQGGTDQHLELGSLVQSRGFTTKGGRLRRAQLSGLLVGHSAKRYEHSELDAMLSNERTVHRLLSPLWARRGCLHPIIAHALICALRELPENQQGQLWPSPRQTKLAALDESLAVSRTMAEAANLAGVSTTTAVVHAQSRGVEVSVRPKRLKGELLSLLKSLLATGESPEAVAQRTSVSVVSVYRVLRRNPELQALHHSLRKELWLQAKKTSWAALLDANPQLSKAELRELEPGLFAYLYRNCPEWLKAVTVRPTASRKPLNFQSRAPLGAEFALAQRIKAAGDAKEPATAQRKTRTRLLLAAGRPNRIPQSAKLARRILSEKSETIPEFVRRRIRNASRQLLDDGVETTRWRIERASRLRPAVVQASGLQLDVIVDEERVRAYARRMP